ncbi:MAG: tRNA (guanosine(37)-N1)-methyltransferase TrmD [Candidatus Babeliales bacterium]
MSIHISVLTVFEQLYKPFLQTSLIHGAQKKNIVDINVSSFFSYVDPKTRIDAPTFGPGPGMLIRPAVVEAAIEDKERQYGSAFTIFFSPQGKKLDQQLLVNLANEMQKKPHILLVPARYEGMDTRVENYYADLILSVGDFVLMGGDLPAMVFLEGILRLFPGVVGKEESVEKESFSGPFVDFPAYTRPIDWKGYLVPAIVRSGNHAAINEWRMEQAAQDTVLQHFNWLRTQHVLTDKQKNLVKKFIPSHYLAFYFNDMFESMEKDNELTLLKLLTICDIACSSSLYGLTALFLNLKPEKKNLLKDYFFNNIENSIRKNAAISLIKSCKSINSAINMIIEKEGKKPLLVGITNLSESNNGKTISFYDQSLVWESQRPVLFIFNIDAVSSDQINKDYDFLLPPPSSLAGGGNLSMSSLIAVVFDRWFGVNLR